MVYEVRGHIPADHRRVFLVHKLIEMISDEPLHLV
jgi:hypothetical protein